jgi:hypothetical protein
VLTAGTRVPADKVATVFNYRNLTPNTGYHS